MMDYFPSSSPSILLLRIDRWIQAIGFRIIIAVPWRLLRRLLLTFRLNRLTKVVRKSISILFSLNNAGLNILCWRGDVFVTQLYAGNVLLPCCGTASELSKPRGIIRQVRGIDSCASKVHIQTPVAKGILLALMAILKSSPIFPSNLHCETCDTAGVPPLCCVFWRIDSRIETGGNIGVTTGIVVVYRDVFQLEGHFVIYSGNLLIRTLHTNSLILPAHPRRIAVWLGPRIGLSRGKIYLIRNRIPLLLLNAIISFIRIKTCPLTLNIKIPYLMPFHEWGGTRHVHW